MKSLLLALLALYPALAASQDKLKIEGIAPGEEVVVMLFGRTSAGCMNGSSDPEKTTFSTTGELLLGNMLSKGRCRSQAVAVFSKKHAMKWQSLNWTNQPGDVRTIKLDPLIDAALNIWVTNDADKLLAEEHAQRAQDIFLDNRVGVRLVPKVQKLSDVPGAPSNAVQIVNSGLVDDNFLECSHLAAIRAQPFYVAKTLNVYYVSRPFTGRNCALKNLDFGECPTSADGEFTRPSQSDHLGARTRPRVRLASAELRRPHQRARFPRQHDVDGRQHRHRPAQQAYARPGFPHEYPQGRLGRHDAHPEQHPQARGADVLSESTPSRRRLSGARTSVAMTVRQAAVGQGLEKIK
jgi:hypothetical protein